MLGRACVLCLFSLCANGTYPHLALNIALNIEGRISLYDSTAQVIKIPPGRRKSESYNKLCSQAWAKLMPAQSVSPLGFHPGVQRKTHA